MQNQFPSQLASLLQLVGNPQEQGALVGPPSPFPPAAQNMGGGYPDPNAFVGPPSPMPAFPPPNMGGGYPDSNAFVGPPAPPSLRDLLEEAIPELFSPEPMQQINNQGTNPQQQQQLAMALKRLLGR